MIGEGKFECYISENQSEPLAKMQHQGLSDWELQAFSLEPGKPRVLIGCEFCMCINDNAGGINGYIEVNIGDLHLLPYIDE